MLALPAAAQDPGSPNPEQLVQALASKVDLHEQQLMLPDAPPVYHLRYHLMQLQQAQARASFGNLLSSDASPMNVLGVEVRVGSAAFDNTGYGGWESGFGRRGLPDELSLRSLDLASWRLTDSSYKEAVEQFARKQAAFSPPPDHPGDYQLGLHAAGGSISQPSLEQEQLARLARQLSAAFPTDGSLELGTVIAAWEAGTATVVDSEGSALHRPHAEVVLRAMAHARSEDGALISDHRSWLLRDPSQLPTEDELVTSVRELAASLQGWAQAEPLEDEYVGPVIFEDQAAVELFRTLLVPQLEGTPPPVPFEARFGPLGSGFGLADDGTTGARLGRRVLPEGWTAVDDPQRLPEHPASFTHDQEGTPAQAVELVTGGIVRTVLMSRVPRKDLPGSNGHARGSLGSRFAGRVAMLEVQPNRALSERRVLRKGLELAAAYGHDHVILVRRFQDDTVRAQDRTGGAMSFMGSDALQLPLPLALVRVYADGHEEPLRGAAFVNVQRWALRDIAAAGPQVRGSFLAPFDPGGTSFSPVVGMPTWLSVPQVLVEELELVPVAGDPRDLPVVAAPGT